MVHCKYHGYILISQALSLLTPNDTICSILMEGWLRSTHIFVTVDSGALLLYFWSVLYFVHRSNGSLTMRGQKQGLICQWIPKILWTWISSNKYIHSILSSTEKNMFFVRVETRFSYKKYLTQLCFTCCSHVSLWDGGASETWGVRQSIID